MPAARAPPAKARHEPTSRRYSNRVSAPSRTSPTRTSCCPTRTCSRPGSCTSGSGCPTSPARPRTRLPPASQEPRLRSKPLEPLFTGYVQPVSPAPTGLARGRSLSGSARSASGPRSGSGGGGDLMLVQLHVGSFVSRAGRNGGRCRRAGRDCRAEDFVKMVVARVARELMDDVDRRPAGCRPPAASECADPPLSCPPNGELQGAV